MKTSGFNIEDTHLNKLERLSTLISVVSIAFIWAYLAGIDKHEKLSQLKSKTRKKSLQFLQVWVNSDCSCIVEHTGYKRI